MANYREGPWQGIAVPATGYGIRNAMGIQGQPSARINTAVGGRSSGIQYGPWTPDWDNPVDVNNAAAVYKRLAVSQRSYASNIDPARDYLLGPDAQPSWRDSTQGIVNPYHSQGLGPADYSGKYISDMARDQARWYEASQRKFELRGQELRGYAAAGGQDAYEEQRAARRLLGKPFPEAARAAELLRSERGPRAGGGGGGQPGASRQTSRAGSAERRRLGTNRSASGGSVSRKRLRAASMLGQPLGGGSQSAAQVLG